MPDATAVVRTEKSELAQVLDTKKETILHLLNKRLDLEYFMSTALLHVSEKEDTFKIARANPMSFVRAVVKSAEFGLGFAKGLAYLVPFGNEIVFMPGYIGLMQVMLRENVRIHDINARMVYRNELFKQVAGTRPDLIHEPLETTEERGAMRGAYAVALFRDGNLPHYEYLPIEELEKRREAAKARNNGKESPAFKKWPEEMYLRPPIRKLFKFLPQTKEGQKIMAYEDELWGYDNANVVEVEHHGDRTRQLSDKLKARTTPPAAKPEPEDASFQDIPPEPIDVVPPDPAETLQPESRPNDTLPTGQTIEKPRTPVVGPIKTLLDKLNRREVTMVQLRAAAKELNIKFGVPQNLTEEEAKAILEKL